MTNFVYCEAGTVLQSDLTANKAAPGWIEAPDYVTPGYLYDGHDFTVPVVTLTLDDVLAKLAARRWIAQVGGTTVGGVPVKTDDVTTATLTAAYVKAKENPAYTIGNWKVAPGQFVTLNAATIIVIANAVAAHVQTCFDNESVLSAAVQAAADPATVDLEQGWPS